MTVGLSEKFISSVSATLIVAANSALSTPDGVAVFDFQAFADGRLAALPIAKFPEVHAWFAKFPVPDVVGPLAPNDDHIGKLKFIETRLVWAPNGEGVRVFRKSSEARIAKPEDLIARLTGTGYEYVDVSQSLIFDMQIDFFVWDNILFVPNYKNLESILNFREITHSVALSVCNSVFQLLPVTNSAALRDAVLAGARHLNKMARLKDKPHIPILDMTKIQAVITKANLPLTIANVAGVPTLSVDPADPLHVKAYLHILADDYVESMMTKLHYIGVGKEPI